jgi:hypothetical protein
VVRSVRYTQCTCQCGWCPHSDAQGRHQPNTRAGQPHMLFCDYVFQYTHTSFHGFQNLYVVCARLAQLAGWLQLATRECWRHQAQESSSGAVSQTYAMHLSVWVVPSQ